MLYFIGVDHSNHAEREITRLIRKRQLAGSTICICMAVNPLIPVDAVDMWAGIASNEWVIALRANRRVEELQRLFRFLNVTVETDVYETRFPESVALLLRANHFQADHFIAGVHSVLGVRRRMLQALFDILPVGRREPPKRNPDCGPGADSEIEYQHAA